MNLEGGAERLGLSRDLRVAFQPATVTPVCGGLVRW